MTNAKISRKFVLRSDPKNNFAVVQAQRSYLHHRMYEYCLNAQVIGTHIVTLELHHVTIDDLLDEAMKHFQNLRELKLVNFKVTPKSFKIRKTWNLESLKSLEVIHNTTFLVVRKTFH